MQEGRSGSEAALRVEVDPSPGRGPAGVRSEVRLGKTETAERIAGGKAW